MRRLLGSLVLLLLFSPLALTKTCELLDQAPETPLPYYEIETEVGTYQKGCFFWCYKRTTHSKRFVTKDTCECYLTVGLDDKWQCQVLDEPGGWRSAVTVTTQGNDDVVEYRTRLGLWWTTRKKVPQDMVQLHAGKDVELKRLYGRTFGAVFRQKKSAEKRIRLALKVKLGRPVRTVPILVFPLTLHIPYHFPNPQKGLEVAVNKKKLSEHISLGEKMQDLGDDVKVKITRASSPSEVKCQRSCRIAVEGTDITGNIPCEALTNTVAIRMRAEDAANTKIMLMDIQQADEGILLTMLSDDSRAMAASGGLAVFVKDGNKLSISTAKESDRGAPLVQLVPHHMTCLAQRGGMLLTKELQVDAGLVNVLVVVPFGELLPRVS